MKFNKLTFKLESGDTVLEFDSVESDRKAAIAEVEPFFEMFRIMSKLQTTYVFNKDGSVKTVEVPAKVDVTFEPGMKVLPPEKE